MERTASTGILRIRPATLLAALAALVWLAAAACDGSSPSPPTPIPPGSNPPPGVQIGTLVGAGDIAMCGSTGSMGTAALLDAIDGTVFTAGDNAYFQGSAAQYAQCYDPTWGRHRDRTRPAPGNHEYETPGASGYFDYFGASAGPRGRGYYSFMVGEWLIVSLNSNVPAGDGSAQLQWLRDEVSRSHTRCVAAIWHHPTFSSGINGSSPVMRDIWRTLRELGADVVVAGHEHLYERFARQDETGRPTAEGLRQFTVGTGGAELTNPVRVAANSEVRFSTFGVLKLTLRPDSYTWQFIAVPPATFTDTGSDACR